MNDEVIRNEKNQAVLDFMNTRRSVPSKVMGEPKPNDIEIQEILKIASRVPDHGKLAPWRYVQFGERAKERLNSTILKRALALDGALNEEMQSVESNRFPSTQTILALISSPIDHPKVPVWEQELSAGASAMSFLIGANALGYDAQWFTGWYAFDETLREEYGLKSGERIAGFLHVGTRKMAKSERARPNLQDIYSLQAD